MFYQISFSFFFSCIYNTQFSARGSMQYLKLLYPNNELLKQIEIKHIDVLIN